MKLSISPKDYEYLWTDYDIDYIFVSCYLFKEFKATDIVLIYDNKTKGLSFFLSKSDHKKLSNIGVRFYREEFRNWKRSVLSNISKGMNLIDITKKDHIKSLSSSQIKEKILERVKLFQDLASNYFYTEFFFLDKVEKSKDRTIRDNIKTMGKIKLKARGILNKFYNYDIIFKPYISEISIRKKRGDLRWISYQEISGMIDNKDVPVSDRDKKEWVLAKKSNWEIIEGKEAKIIKNGFEDYFFKKKENKVRGIVANKGKYKGKVKMIKTIFSDKIKEEVSKFRKGDVLVANTTGPETMSAIQKAGAIVTDEGGLASHAAIVSRELKIPCIVGTKIATKIFKDSDLVEVDANKGIVRKLK